MAIADFFVETIAKLESIKKAKVIPNTKVSNNHAKTRSNVNDVFHYVNVWDNQIDEMIQANSYSFDTAESAIFIELRLGRCAPLLNKVTTYPEAVCVFHIFSMKLGSQGDDKMEKNLDIFKYRDIAKSKLTGWGPSNCSNFMCFDDALDYKHGNITKYLIGFNFHLTDFSGSIFDEDSPNYLKFITKTGITLGSVSLFNDWVSGIQYTAQISVVAHGVTGNTPNIYLCTTDNNDIDFDPAKWQLIASWVSAKPYVVDDMVYIFNRVYKCTVANSDDVFNPANWEMVS